MSLKDSLVPLCVNSGKDFIFHQDLSTLSSEKMIDF